MKRCMKCMREFDSNMESCPYCGREYTLEPNNSKHLYPNVVLNERYEIGYALDVNSIFVTYRAWDRENEEMVLINEFLPNNFASRNKGNKQVLTKSGEAEEKYYAGMCAFADECQDLIDIESTDIIGGFEENNTYYAVRRIVKGTSLAEIIDDDYEVTNEYARHVIVAVLKAIEPVHNLGIIHGNITPDNIIIDENSAINIIDFSFCGYMSRIMPVYTNEGYSPVEQYIQGTKLTTCVDIYSIAAVYYELITGVIPETATSRYKQDTLIPISEVKGVTLRPSICNAIMNALNVRVEFRTQSIEDFYNEIKDKNTKRRWERFSKKEDKKNDFYKDKRFWKKGFIIFILAVILICVAVVAIELVMITKNVENEKERQSEVSTESISSESGKSIFDIFKNTDDETEEDTEETTEEVPRVPDDVESGSGILAIFSRN